MLQTLDPSFTFERAQEVSQELVDYVEHIEWGFEASVRYRILERRRMLNHIFPKSSLQLLRKENHLIGSVLSLQKTIALGNGITVQGSYISLLSVSPGHHGKGHAKRLVQATDHDAPEQEIQYAYVENNNVPSAAVFKALGFQDIGQFLTVTFNRFLPALSPRASRLLPEQEEWIRDRLEKLYRGHAFLDINLSFQPDAYWVLIQEGQIVAGAQVEEELWSITSMPGPDGWFAVNVLPSIPFLNNILNPKRIPLLKMSHLYIAEGQEKEFIELISHLTHHYRKTLALAYLDPRSPVYQRLKKTLWFGLFNLFFETPVTIWARCQGFEQKDIQALREKPFVISPLDIS